MTEYRYALVNRPPMIGAVPRGFIRHDPRPDAGQDHYDRARHGVIVYNRPLSTSEMRSFELEPLIDGDDRRAMAREIADIAGEYREAILELAADGETDIIHQSVANALDRTHQERPSVGDFDAFVAMVIDQLRNNHAQ